MDEINQKEWLLIDELSRSPESTQRGLSQQTGLSLGLTNLLLKRLAQKGYIKVQQLNWNKVRYILTVRGTLEKARKSYAFASRTFQEFKRMSSLIRGHILEGYAHGLRQFVIAAPSDLEEFIRGAIENMDLPGATYVFEAELEQALGMAKTVYCALPGAIPRVHKDQRVVHLLEQEPSRGKLSTPVPSHGID